MGAPGTEGATEMASSVDASAWLLTDVVPGATELRNPQGGAPGGGHGDAPEAREAHPETVNSEFSPSHRAPVRETLRGG
jgi:hypothetical protein